MIASQALLFASIGAVLGALIVWLVTRAETAALRASLHHAQRAEEKAVESLLERAKNELRETTAMRASERVGELVSPMAEKLAEFDRLISDLEARRSHDAGSLREQIDLLLGRADKLESAAASLSTQTSTLVTALRNPASRGKWGEMQLRNVVEKAGMVSYCDFSEQQTVAVGEARTRPDMTINLPGERCVFVDAKAPVDAMQAALETTDEQQRKVLTKQHARALRDHVDSLARRGYHTAAGSADYVVMFVAGEAFLSSACTEDPALIEYALDRGVLVTGPLSLVSLLRTFAIGWQALRQEENAKRIATIGKALYERACKFSEHLVEVRRHLERTVNAFNATVGSYESKFLPQGRRLKEEAALAAGELADLPPIDVVPREVTALDTNPTEKRLPRSQRLLS
ncbi:MAG: DNA recombination protein RmuC [Candidatus Eremiobacteraeota bacterium]|nr:DNA recombination protein RmuC [Candidatus Eremiobacteraeota bacterium]